MMNVMQKRNSIRKYTNQLIEEEKIKELLKSGMQAPSAKNQQPWEFIVVDDKKLLQKMSEASKGSWPLSGAPLAIITIMKPTDKSPYYAVQDLSAATENILLEATNQGLGAVWIGCYPLEERTSLVKSVLQIPSPYEPFSVIAIGYPDETREMNYRYDETRIHHNRWEK
jgi:nitroreductase